MADITRIAMKHQHCEILTLCCLWSSDVECGKLFSIGSGDHKLFEVGKTELRRSGDIGAGEIRNVGGVDESSVLQIISYRCGQNRRVDGGAHTFA